MNSNTIFPVVPLCEKQLRDVRPEDVLFDGLARKCNIYKGGGGYDKFNEIYEKRFGGRINPVQFVVQLRGCPFSCEYCYVTKDGVWGDPTKVSAKELLSMFYSTELDVFHLMGGAPAMHLKKWKSISEKVKVFHSDFLLVEHEYKKEELKGLSGLFAVSFKEFTPDKELVHKNLRMLMSCGVNFYITFTGKPEPWREKLRKKYGEEILKDSFAIDIKPYEALK